MSGWVLYPLTFLTGFMVCWWWSRAVVRHVFRKQEDLTRDIIQGLPQRSLLKVHNTVLAELELRKKGTE